MKHYLLDTNMLVRYLTGTPLDQARVVRNLFELNEAGKLKIILLPLVVAEAVFVLTGSVYQLDHQKVSEVLKSFIQSPSLKVRERESLIQACDLFAQSKIDFVDAYLVASAQVEDVGVASFDNDFKKFPKVDLWKA